MPKQLIKTPPIGFTQDNFCAVVDPRSPNPKTETRRLSNGSDKPKYKVGDRCYLTEPTQIESAPDQAFSFSEGMQKTMPDDIENSVHEFINDFGRLSLEGLPINDCLTKLLNTTTNKALNDLQFKRFAQHCVVNYFWSNPESLWKEITLDDKLKIESRKSGIKSKQNPRFMLKSFARYWVEIVDVNHERLRDITDEAAIAEGIKSTHNTYDGKTWYWDYTKELFNTIDPIHSYFSEIAYIHKPSKDKIGGWDLVKSNPWLWVYKFKLSQGGDEHV
jgi:hypothetical protein